MDFTILSHAGLRVRHEGAELLCDPWIVGSTYWRSWWNFPPPSRELIESLDPDAIYLTHVHWDHFAGPSLRRFSKDTEFIIPLEPVGRMRRDLERMGFHNVIELGWGESRTVGGRITLTSYPFSVFTDSAAVIEADGVTLFNCNDAKLMGPPLSAILGRHRDIDFVFRSHSSANSRAVTHVIGAAEPHIDNREAYVTDFLALAAATEARYAIPFASNHCHLHPEVEQFNSYVVAPDEVLNQSTSRTGDTNVQIMLPGDTWSTEDGFVTVARPEMADKSAYLKTLQQEAWPLIEASMAREARVQLNLRIMEDLVHKYFNGVPRIVRRRFNGFPVLLILKAGDVTHLVELDVGSLSVSAVAADRADDYEIRIEAPLMVILQCLALRLFSHLAISKRANYYATPAALRRLRELGLLFNFIEYEYFPLRNLTSGRFIRAWASRWREMLLYLHIGFDLLVRRRTFAYTNYLH